MTQEEKAIKYDEALANARQEYNTTENVERKQWLEELFPELKINEDERIRKEFCKDIWTFIPNEKAHKYIAWLEKQNDKKSALSEEDERIRKRIYNYINVTLDDNESEEKEKWLVWLEKQGKDATKDWTSPDDRQDDKINEDFRNLHQELVNRIAEWCKKHNVIIDEFSLGADGFAESCKDGEWVSATDSSFSCRKFSEEYKKAFWDMDRSFSKEDYDRIEQESRIPYLYSM